MTVRLAPSEADRRHLHAVDAGTERPDLVLTNARVVDVQHEVLLEGLREVAIAGSRIAGVSEAAGRWRRSEPPVVDCRGGFLLPGFIDAHTHAVKLTVQETSRLQLRCGVTTTVLDPNDFVCRTGREGFLSVLEEAAAAPGRVLLWLPPCIGLDPDREAELDREEWESLLDEPRVVGVGEAYWADLLRGHLRARELIASARARGLCVDGHGAGAPEPALRALAQLGVDADHEAIDAEQARLRLDLGLYALLREGVSRHDLADLAGLWRDLRAPLDRAAFVTDGSAPQELLAGRGVNAVVADAIELELPELAALRLGTFNPAQRLKLAPWLGTLASGALADLQLKRSLGDTLPELVLVDGRIADHAAPLAEVARPELGLSPRAPGPDLLSHPGPGSWRAADLRPEAPLVTREVHTDGSDAAVLVALAARGERAFRGLLRGFGLQAGAVALSSAADSSCIVATGADPADLNDAIQAVVRLQGGAAVVGRGRLLATWRADVAGLLSTAPAAEVARQVREVDDALRSLGCPLPAPLLTLEFMSSPAIPHLRIWPGGYVRLKDGARLGLEW